jgi:hypothetical protein
MNQIYKTRKSGSVAGFSSLSPAQRQQQDQRFRSRTASQTRTIDRKKPKTMKDSYAPGTLGRKFKGKYVTVPITKGTSRRRYVDHEQVDATHCLYTSFNDMGPKAEFLKTLAEAMLLHYMHRCGDYRVNTRDAAIGPTTFRLTGTDGTVSTWKTMRLHWRKKQLAGSSEVVTHFDLDAWTIADEGPGAIQPNVIHNTWPSMVNGLAENLDTYSKYGYEITAVTMFRGDRHQWNATSTATTMNTVSDQPILYDTSAGRNIFKFSTIAKLKIQNTTNADDTADPHNKDNIHANPLDGLVYRFRNMVPKFQSGFLNTAGTDRNTLNGLESLAEPKIHGVSHVNLSGLCGQQFHVPPPAPYTIFTNCSGRAKILIKPGEHRTLQLKETFNGSVNDFMKRYTAVTDKYADGTNQSGDIPPGGNCLMVALKPTFRTGTNEALEIQYEMERTLYGLIKTRPLTCVPITNIMS